MARTKNNAVRCGATPAKKCQGRNYSVRNLCRRSGRTAFAQLRVRIWKSTNAVFANLKNYSYATCPSRASFVILRRTAWRCQGLKKEAINALHYIAESSLVRIFKDANLIARHAKRITIYNTEIRLVLRICGEIE